MGNAATDAEPPALFLAGTIAFDDPGSGFAILGESTDTARFRGVGSEVSPGLLLKAVFRDRVLVGQGESSFTIRLPTKLAAGMASLYSSLPTGGDGQLVGNVFAFTPTYDEKTLVGVKITPGLDTATFEALGLRAGDSIAEFAHQNITDPAESLWSLANIQPGEEIEITVMRNGGYIDMTVNGTQVTKKRNQILAQQSAKPVSSK
jgi:type II secretory pathway component PulC